MAGFGLLRPAAEMVRAQWHSEDNVAPVFSRFAPSCQVDVLMRTRRAQTRSGFRATPHNAFAHPSTASTQRHAYRPRGSFNTSVSASVLNERIAAPSPLLSRVGQGQLAWLVL